MLGRSRLCVLLIVVLAACGGGGSNGGGDGGGDDDTPDGGNPGPDGAIGSCPAETLGLRIGKDHLLIGGGMDDTAFAAAPFDLRNIYVSGDVPDPGPCARCDVGCTVRGDSCANTAGCGWWGCWQYDQDPPGRYVADFVSGALQAGAVPMITYYEWFSVAGDVEGGAEIGALTDGARVSRFLADWRFLCQTIAATTAQPVILHIEPDLWGYAEQQGAADGLPAAVAAGGAAECAALPDTVAGFTRCLVAIARAEAPAVLIGFHASAWGAGADAHMNTDPGFDLNAHADATAAYLTSLGADSGDLIVVEMSDRDAGFNMRWWDKTNATLPNFTQAITWAGRLGADLNLPPLWWQVPYGHEGLPNTCDQYEDNRVAYVFDHAADFAAAGSVGVSFGAGAGCMTTPATDDGYFVGRAMGYFGASPPPLCGP